MLRPKLYGFTLVEVLVVMSIIVLLSVYFLIDLRPDTGRRLQLDSEQIISDVRYIRNLAATRTMHNGVYPNGYGIAFINGNGTNVKSKYVLYDGSNFFGYNDPNSILKTVELGNVKFRLVDPNKTPYNYNDTEVKHFLFRSENSISTNLQRASSNGQYQIEIYYPYLIETTEFFQKSTISLGYKSEDDYFWSNLAVVYDARVPECGNGRIEPGEYCDDGAQNGLTGSNCKPKIVIDGVVVERGCSYNICGDGFVMGTEECDWRGVPIAPCPPGPGYYQCKSCDSKDPPGSNNIQTCYFNGSLGSSCCPNALSSEKTCRDCLLSNYTCKSNVCIQGSGGE